MLHHRRCLLSSSMSFRLRQSKYLLHRVDIRSGVQSVWNATGYNPYDPVAFPSNVFIRHFSTENIDKDKDLHKNENLVESNSKKPKTDYKKMAVDMVRKGVKSTYLFFRHPSQIPMKLKYMWNAAKEEAHHYYLGFKLLSADVRTAKNIMFRVLEGHAMTRRERLQLMRTVTDLARLVPFSLFIVIPFMELLLPVAIKMFPNMLPSTFEDSMKREENMKNELSMRLSVASFFIDTIKTMAEKKKKKTKDGQDGDNATATELIQFMEKARMGEPLSHDTVVRIARLFKDELTLANMPRPQLVTMCQFMNLPPFGSDAFLRFQLRTKLNTIKEDDKRILWEGVDSLSTQELQEACRERGMIATGLNTFGYRKQIKEWLDLSMLKHTPISLLIMSRAFVLNLSKENRQLCYEERLQTSISSMDEDVINEVIVQSASAKESESAEMKKRKLESLEFQNEMIQEELELEKEYKRKAAESAELKKRKLESVQAVQDELGKEKECSNNAIQVEGEARTSQTPLIIGIGDDHTNALSDSNFDIGTVEPIREPHFEKDYIRAVEGTKFDGDISADTDDINLQKKSGTSLTASELRALGDMALQSAVEREKSELAKLKKEIAALKLETKKKKAKKIVEDIPIEEVSVDTDKILSEFEKEKSIDTNVVTALDEKELESHDVKLQTLLKEESERIKRVQELSGRLEELDIEINEPPPADKHPKKDDKEEGDEDHDEEDDSSLLLMKKLVDGMMLRLEDRVSQTESALGDKLHKLDVDRDGMVDSEELKTAVMQLLRREAKDESSQEAADLIKLLDQDNDGKITVKELIEYVTSHAALSDEEAKMFESLKQKEGPASSNSKKEE